jgi:AhpD family alkylhydroperoxidase
MRLPEIERGDGFANRLLIGFISMVSGMRLPDAARVAFFHKSFFGAPMGAWTQAAMRGPSEWSVGERELMAAMVAKWNSCAFCVGAHGAVAAKTMERPLVDAVLANFRSAPVSEPLKGALAFLEIMTLRPTELTPEHAKAALRSEVSIEALKDAIAVGTLFNKSRGMPMRSISRCLRPESSILPLACCSSEAMHRGTTLARGPPQPVAS